MSAPKIKWEQGEFMIAFVSAPEKRSGYVCAAGLGLHEWPDAPGYWTVTHLNTGHAVCRLCGSLDEVLPIATEVAECGDWTFGAIGGWKKIDPSLCAKVLTVCLCNHDRAEIGASNHQEPAMAERIAAGRGTPT